MDKAYSKYYDDSKMQDSDTMAMRQNAIKMRDQITTSVEASMATKIDQGKKAFSTFRKAHPKKFKTEKELAEDKSLGSKAKKSAKENDKNETPPEGNDSHSSAGRVTQKNREVGTGMSGSTPGGATELTFGKRATEPTKVPLTPTTTPSPR